MPTFDSTGVPINYIVEGEGPPVVLVHGFASNLQGNWRAPGTVAALTAAGRQVVALDCRGHGRSGKPHDPAAYGENAMANDVLALMDHLGIDKADLVGYSMGSLIAAGLLVQHPERFHTVTLAGVGDAVLDGGRSREMAEQMAAAMESPDSDAGTTPTARAFRLFAERSGNDLQALAAMQRAPHRHETNRNQLAEVTLPVMVLIGDTDTLVGAGDRLAAAIPGAKLAVVPGDHLTALAQPAFREALVSFLAEHSPIAAR